MKKNVGKVDRNIRIIIGVVLLAAGIVMQIATGWRIGMFAVAAIAFVTAFTGFCPLWAALGISTIKEHKEEASAAPEEKVTEKHEETPEEKGKPEGQ